MSYEVREVKRLAKIGEYVRIVDMNKYDPSNEYQIGDILKIVAVSGECAYYKKEESKFLDEYEYVVLEGYNPTTSTSERE